MLFMIPEEMLIGRVECSHPLSPRSSGLSRREQREMLVRARLVQKLTADLSCKYLGEQRRDSIPNHSLNMSMSRLEHETIGEGLKPGELVRREKTISPVKRTRCRPGTRLKRPGWAGFGELEHEVPVSRPPPEERVAVAAWGVPEIVLTFWN